MPHVTEASPQLMPVLSRGKHRTARRGACFMEYASYLAGERWSDHPPCTHPALALLARVVNDSTSDAGRSRLVPLIPAVIGLVGADPLLDLSVAVRAAVAAFPIASESRQRCIAVGLLYCNDVLLERRGPHADYLRSLIDDSLACAPAALDWAIGFRTALGTSDGRFDHAMQVLTTISVVGISEACVPDTDDRLRAVLEAAISECAAVNGRDVSPVGTDAGRRTRSILPSR